MAARGYEFYLFVLKVYEREKRTSERFWNCCCFFNFFFLVGKVILRSEIGQGNSAVLV